MSTQRESRRSVNPILHIWASKLSFFILLLKLKWVGFISHFMVLYFRNVDLDLPKISELFWTPVLSRYGDENLTSWKNRLVHLWPTSFIRANYVQLPQQNFSRTPLVTRHAISIDVQHLPNTGDNKTRKWTSDVPSGHVIFSWEFPFNNFRFSSPFNILIMADDKIWKHQNIFRNPKGIWELVFVLSFQRLCVHAFTRECVVPWGINHVGFTRPLPHRLGYFRNRVLFCPVIVPHPDAYPSLLPIMTYEYFSVSVDGRIDWHMIQR